MFMVSEEDAAAIRTIFEKEGELSAAIEVRRLFPGITDNAMAREHARIIAGWRPMIAPVPRRSRRGAAIRSPAPAAEPGATEKGTPFRN
jgi:hypothetical protein